MLNDMKQEAMANKIYEEAKSLSKPAAHY